MKSFRTVISCDYPTYIKNSEGKNVLTYERCYLPIDVIKPRNVTSSSQIASHPLLNGDTISDHMYRQPNTLTLNGTFSLNGRNINNKTYQNLSKNNFERLSCIQEVFETIKNQALLCTITTIETEMDRGDSIKESDYVNANRRFITRERMALNNITWTEGVNDLSFTFNFKEIMSAQIEEFEVDIDPDLPFPGQPKASSIGTVLYESGSLAQSVIQILYDNGYIKDDFMRKVAEVGAGAGGVIAAIAIVAVAVGLIKVSVLLAMAGITTATGAIFPVGTIVAIAAVAVTAIVMGIKKFCNWLDKNKKRSKIIKLVNGKPDEGIDKLTILLNKIGKAMNNTMNNLLIYNFEFENDEESKSVNTQYCFVVGGEYYFVNIISINKSPWFEAQIFTSSNGGEKINPKQLKNDWCVVTNLEECDSSHIWFTDSTYEYRVYLVNVNMNDEVNKTEEEKLNTRRCLSSYTIWICKGSMKEQLKIINDTIIEQLDVEGYK